MTYMAGRGECETIVLPRTVSRPGGYKPACLPCRRHASPGRYASFTSTSMSCGAKTTGTLAEAARTSRNSLNAFGPSNRGDGAHIPDDGSLRVKVGRDNQEAPSLFILARDRVDYIVVEIVLDKFAQPPAIEQPGAEDRPKGIGLPDQVFRLAARIYLLEPLVIVGPEKGEGAISAPVETPETVVNSGRAPDCVQPLRMPAP